METPDIAKLMFKAFGNHAGNGGFTAAIRPENHGEETAGMTAQTKTEKTTHLSQTFVLIRQAKHDLFDSIAIRLGHL